MATDILFQNSHTMSIDRNAPSLRRSDSNSMQMKGFAQGAQRIEFVRYCQQVVWNSVTFSNPLLGQHFFCK